MLLIIFLGLIAKLALVSGNCTSETGYVKNFDYPTATGNWTVVYHTSNDFDNGIGCVEANYGYPEGNTSSITLKGYDKSTGILVTVRGVATNWSDNGCWIETFQDPSLIWNGQYCVLAYDYDRYIILKVCSSVTNEELIYVAFRNLHPDKQTVKRVKQELKKHGIDIEGLVYWWSGDCQQAV